MPLIAAIIKGIKYKAIIMINGNASIKIYTIFLNSIQGTWQQNAPYCNMIVRKGVVMTGLEILAVVVVVYYLMNN